MSTAHDGSTSVRNPALVFGAGLITSPRPFTRITVPRTSTVPAARSTASHVTATLAHPQSRRQQHVDKIRQITFPSLVVVAEPRPQLASLSNTQSARNPLRPARTDSAGISYGVVLKCVMAGSQPGHSGQYCSAQLRQRRAVLSPNRPQMAVDYPRSCAPARVGCRVPELSDRRADLDTRAACRGSGPERVAAWACR
jgi:hypothetical protein